MTATVGAAARSVIGARVQPALHPRVEPRFHPRADAARARRGLSLAPCTRRAAGCCRSSPWCSGSWSWRPRCRRTRQPALHGNGLIVLAVARRVRACCSAFGVDLPHALRRPAAAPPCAARRRSALRARSWRSSQPDGAGVLALYITLGIACARLEPRRAIPLFTVGIVVVERAARAGRARRHAGRHDHRRRQRGHLLLHGLHVRASSGWGRRAPSSSSRSSRPAARRRRRRSRCASASTSRARCTTCSPTRSPRSPSSSRARGCSRARTGADPSVVDAVERSHHLAKGGLDEARRAIEALRGGDMPGPDRLRRARRRVPRADRRRRPRSRSTASRASCPPRRGWPCTGRRRRR